MPRQNMGTGRGRTSRPRDERPRAGRTFLLLWIAAVVAIGGCNVVLGLGDFTDAPDGSGAETCVDPAVDCPTPADVCRVARCSEGACAEGDIAAGMPASTQIPGDCKEVQCDGSGNATTVDVASDPEDDENQCTVDACNEGEPVHLAVSAGTVCAESGGKLCDSAGGCVECLAAADCASGVCVAGACQAPGCGDGVLNGNETDVDCGGTCGPCEDGSTCVAGTDCVSLACDNGVCAARPVPIWSKSFGDAAAQSASETAVDASGNIVVVGTSFGNIDFGGGPLLAQGGSYIAKLDPSGAHVWSKGFGNLAASVRSVGVDGSGNVIAVGSFSGTLDIGNGPLVSSGGTSDVFVAKFDPGGNLVWSNRLGGTGQEYAQAVAIDSTGAPLLTGSFSGTADFGGGPVSGSGTLSVFVAKLDANGGHLWSRGFGSGDTSFGSSIAVDASNNLIVAGETKGTLTFDQSSLAFFHPNGYAHFAASFDSLGAFRWQHFYASTSSIPRRVRVATSASANTVVFGEFEGSLSAGIDSAGGTDLFVSKLDPLGIPLWTKRFGDSAYDLSMALTVGAAEDIYLLGYFDGSLDFGDLPLLASGGSSVFIARLDAAGSHVYSRAYGDSTPMQDGALSLSSDALFATGDLLAPLDFGLGPLVSSGQTDVFVAKLTP